MTFHAYSYACSIGVSLGVIFVMTIATIGVILSWSFAVGYCILVVYKKASAYYTALVNAQSRETKERK